MAISEAPFAQTRAILGEVGRMIIQPTPTSLTPARRASIQADYARGYERIFSKTPDERFVITARGLGQIAWENALERGRSAAVHDRLDKMFEVASGIMIPDTSARMFGDCGSFSLFSALDGKLYGYALKRGDSPTLWGTAENPMHHDPYTVSKPYTLGMLQAIGEKPEISNPQSYAAIQEALKLPEGRFVHMGGRFMSLKNLLGPDSSGWNRVVMAASSFDYTDEWRAHLIKTFEEISPLSVDRSGDEGYFTTAGWGDEMILSVIQAAEDGLKGDQLQEVANNQVAGLFYTATNPGPLGGQFH